MTYCKECTHKKDAARYNPRKPGAKLCKDGRIRYCNGKGGAPISWSVQMIDDLKRMFPRNSNEDCAEYIGVSVRTMIRKARELGLEKDKGWLHKVWDSNRMIAHFISRSKGYPGSFKKGEHHCPEHEFKKKQITKEVQNA